MIVSRSSALAPAADLAASVGGARVRQQLLPGERAFVRAADADDGLQRGDAARANGQGPLEEGRFGDQDRAARVPQDVGGLLDGVGG